MFRVLVPKSTTHLSQDQFTLNALVIGIVVCLIAFFTFAEVSANLLIPFFLPPYQQVPCDSHGGCILALFFLSTLIHDFGVALWGVFLCTLMAFVALLVLTASAQLDFVEEGDWDNLKEPFVLVFIFFTKLWVLVGVMT